MLGKMFIGVAAAASVLAAGLPATAQEWPSQPIRIVVGTGPGGSFDRLARAMAEPLAEQLGQPVVVENRPGAATHIGHVYFLQQPADGHTLMVTAPNVVATNILSDVADYGLEDFAYINLQWSDYDLVFASKDSGIEDMEGLVTRLRDESENLSVAVIANSSGHQTLLLLLERLGVDADRLRIVTYDDGNELRTALAGGQMDFAITAGDSTISIQDMITPLAVARREAHPAWDVPTLNQALEGTGITVAVIDGTLRSFAAHASLPEEYPERWERIVSAFETILADPEHQKEISSQGIGIDWMGPEKSTSIANEAFETTAEFQYLMEQ
ncbi:tripartite tricarboxylate transporter substrate binding protein [Mesorhizobium sp. CAU 1741]|uniref:tripartite tricarboxylate transporter substrate binding protein n=1 Tax=Mesorhizobium sp. CAU 1741 TaxID=3140366 RepID=UPI00325BB030